MNNVVGLKPAPLYKHICTIDFETYFSKDYSLKSKDLNTSEYVRHPEFKVQVLGIQLDDNEPKWVRGDACHTFFEQIDWSCTALLAHHVHFDGLIASHHFGVNPCFYLDTLSMARALHSNQLSAHLNDVAQFYEVGNKVPDVLDQTKGIRDLDEDLIKQLGTYCAVDTRLCKQIFDKMIQNFPRKELELIDLTARMFCDPVLKIDIPRVQNELENEVANKAKLVEEAGVPPSVLTSNKKFAEELENHGVSPPKKISPTTKKETFAFAKADLKFQELLDHPKEEVRKLVRARLAAKSTIGETRARRFLDSGRDGKRLPVYLNYFGAHTGRWSAANKMNLQNLRRGGELRRSILAPDHHKVIVVDSSQIEARVNAWLAEDEELLGLFRSGAEVYKHMASSIYNKPIEEIDGVERFVGKVAVLGLGYGMGTEKLHYTLQAGSMGPPVDISMDEARKVVTTYRESRHKIVSLWRKMDDVLADMFFRDTVKHYKCLAWHDDKIHLPNHLYLHYPNLKANGFDSENRIVHDVSYTDTKGDRKLYGGLLTENLVQALARIIVAEQMLAISRFLKKREDVKKGTYSRVVTMTHDEVVAIAPEADAEEVFQVMEQLMRMPLPWCEDLPLDCEGGYDSNYSK